MAYKSHGKTNHTSEDVVAKSFNNKTMTLLNELGDSEMKLELRLTNYFKPMYAITMHKLQGMTKNRLYSMYEYKRMKYNMEYVALTRKSNK